MAIEFILFAFLICLLTVYLIGLVFLTIKNDKQFEAQQNWSFKSERPKISILIALRNEENNLLNLLNRLANQDYPKEKFEIILINDHSEDSSELVFSSFISETKLENFIWLNLDNEIFGKKKGIEIGISQASGTFLLFTDGDCQMSESWISDMIICQQNTDAAMVCGSVEFTHNGFLEKCQALEFSSLIAVAASSIEIKKPSLCNAANLLVETKSMKEAETLRKDQDLASGDDVFLLHAFAEISKTISFCRIQGAEIQTSPLPDWKHFKAQRMRWAGKWKSGFSGSNRWLAVSVWLFHFFFLSGLFMAFPKFGLNGFLVIIGLKAVVETFFLKPFASEKSYSKNIGEIWLMQIPYSLYVLYFGISILLSNTYHWKGRNYRY
jgi:biofilm PGA synthesis N-glycosyltransferase PgaC